MGVFHYLRNSLKNDLVCLEVLELSGTAEIKYYTFYRNLMQNDFNAGYGSSMPCKYAIGVRLKYVHLHTDVPL